MPIFSDFTQKYNDWSVRTALYVSTGLFSCEASSLKKNTFQIMFRILDGDFSVFRQKFSSTVVRTSLDSRFLIGFMPTFFGFYAKFYWLVCQNCTLRVHRIIFMGSIFFEKYTFPFVFHILGGNFSGFWANLFHHGIQNWIGF